MFPFLGAELYSSRDRDGYRRLTRRGRTRQAGRQKVAAVPFGADTEAADPTAALLSPACQ